jgi:signal transduction histidine kinase
MAERASLMGGTCSIESALGEGTRVKTSFPLDGA